MTEQQRERIRLKLIRKFERTSGKISDIIVDAAAWNGLHPNERPLDVEAERVVLAVIRRILGHLHAKQKIPRRLAERFDELLVQYAD